MKHFKFLWILLILSSAVVQSLMIFSACSTESDISNISNTDIDSGTVYLNISDPIESVILRHLDYQYEIRNYPENSIYTEEYLPSQVQIPRKGKYKPYKLLSYRKEAPVNNTNAAAEIDIRVADKLGEYIQHVSLAKISGKYLILSIDNDI